MPKSVLTYKYSLILCACATILSDTRISSANSLLNNDFYNRLVMQESRCIGRGGRWTGMFCSTINNTGSDGSGSSIDPVAGLILLGIIGAAVAPHLSKDSIFADDPSQGYVFKPLADEAEVSRHRRLMETFSSSDPKWVARDCSFSRIIYKCKLPARDDKEHGYKALRASTLYNSNGYDAEKKILGALFENHIVMLPMPKEIYIGETAAFLYLTGDGKYTSMGVGGRKGDFSRHDYRINNIKYNYDFFRRHSDWSRKRWSIEYISNEPRICVEGYDGTLTCFALIGKKGEDEKFKNVSLELREHYSGETSYSYFKAFKNPLTEQKIVFEDVLVEKIHESQFGGL